jgi:hypothetical protein
MDLSLPTVRVDLYNVFALFHNLVKSWYAQSAVILATLNQKVTIMLSNFAGDDEALKLIVAPLQLVLNMLGLTDITFLGFLGGSAFSILLLIVIVTVIARWVLDFIPG